MYHELDGRIVKALRRDLVGDYALVGVFFLGLALGQAVEMEEDRGGRLYAVVNLMLR
jgi:hypothetical protein